MQCVQKPTFHHSFSSFITYFHSSTAQISHINSTCNSSYKDVEERNYLNEKQILSKMYADTASRAITGLPADHLWKIVTKLFDYTNSVHDSLLLLSTF